MNGDGFNYSIATPSGLKGKIPQVRNPDLI